MPNSAKERLGMAIRTARSAAGLTQTGLAELLGVNQSHVSRLESGEAWPGFDVLHGVAAAVGRRSWHILALADALEGDDQHGRIRALVFILRAAQKDPQHLALMHFLARPAGRETVQ